MPDYLLYNGPLERGKDLEFIELIAQQQAHENACLILVTPGGSPDAAFKIGRYLQERYQAISIAIPGLCKSAGTLLAMAGHELVFTPYGELGPLDIQMAKEDKIFGMESGLNTSEAFGALERRARDTFHDTVSDILAMSQGVVSFQTAAKCASDIVSALYGPIFANIDPEEVGTRSRAMRIGEDYGKRLALFSGNVSESAITLLARSYPSHGFAIDYVEACSLFTNVRQANEEEARVIASLNEKARFPGRDAEFTKLKVVSPSLDGSTQGAQDATEPSSTEGPRGNSGRNGKASGGAGSREGVETSSDGEQASQAV